MPTISADRRTYTFQIRNDFEFSPPDDRRRHRAEHEVHLRADAEPGDGLAGAAVLHEHRRRDGVHNGQANEITGIVAKGDTLTIQLIQPQGDFLTFLAMPFTCAVPIGLPPVEQLGPIPSAGPYYISENDINQQLIASRNPNYHGPRPQRFDASGTSSTSTRRRRTKQVLSGELDEGPLPAAQSKKWPICTARTAPPRSRGFSSSSPSRSTASVTCR